MFGVRLGLGGLFGFGNRVTLNSAVNVYSYKLQLINTISMCTNSVLTFWTGPHFENLIVTSSDNTVSYFYVFTLL